MSALSRSRIDGPCDASGTGNRTFFAQRLVKAGERISHVQGSFGTLGLGVKSTSIDGTLLLSCAHVLAPRDKLLPRCPDNLIEAPPALNSSPPNRIGTLQARVPFANPSTIDAAVALLDPDHSILPGVVDGVPIRGYWKPSDWPLVGRDVWRIDQDGHKISGTILGFTQTVVKYDDGPDVQFNNIVVYDTPNRKGDSGGAVIDTRSGKLIGLHFGGNGVDRALICLAVLIFPFMQLCEPE